MAAHRCNLGECGGIDHFGESAPAGQLFEAFGFTVDNVVSAVRGRLKRAWSIRAHRYNLAQMFTVRHQITTGCLYFVAIINDYHCWFERLERIASFDLSHQSYCDWHSQNITTGTIQWYSI